MWQKIITIITFPYWWTYNWLLRRRVQSLSTEASSVIKEVVATAYQGRFQIDIRAESPAVAILLEEATRMFEASGAKNYLTRMMVTLKQEYTITIAPIRPDVLPAELIAIMYKMALEEIVELSTNPDTSVDELGAVASRIIERVMGEKEVVDEE